MTVSERSFLQVLDDLRDAAHQLIDERKEMLEGRLLARPSAYSDLVAAVPGTKATEFTRTTARSKSLIWSDAAELLWAIDAGIRGWAQSSSRAAEGASTPELLRVFVEGTFRPQDVEALADVEAQIRQWLAGIQNLLDPPTVREVCAPCPHCRARYAYRRSAGERLRQAALTLVGSEKCVCLCCDAEWPRDQFLFLVRLLGFEAPAGVVG